uniref:Putative secreted protein n=1 Tax=Anopheles triannulatus TaxID=58253 RepID=A0A2M4B296_9DIPT
MLCHWMSPVTNAGWTMLALVSTSIDGVRLRTCCCRVKVDFTAQPASRCGDDCRGSAPSDSSIEPPAGSEMSRFGGTSGLLLLELSTSADTVRILSLPIDRIVFTLCSSVASQKFIFMPESWEDMLDRRSRFFEMAPV